VDTTITDEAWVDVWKDGDFQGRFSCTDTTLAGTDGQIDLQGWGDSVAGEMYLNYIQLDYWDDQDNATLRSYGTTFVKSGNFGNESNPQKSYVGSTFYANLSGLDDLTIGGNYSGTGSRSVVVEIDGTGARDTIKVSYDGGMNWDLESYPISTSVSINYGLTLTFGDITGHTLGGRWMAPCSRMGVRKAEGQKVSVYNIPTSSDAQVDQRKLYRSVSEGASFYWLMTIDNNTNTYVVDNNKDLALGSLVEEDHDVCPHGKFSVWCDDRLWVADHSGKVVYYSETGNPEAFDINRRYVTVQKGNSGDEITQMVVFRDSIYIFTELSVFIIIKQPDGGYGRYQLDTDFGCYYPWSMIEANGYLYFLSDRGWEKFDGINQTDPIFSIPLKRTIESLDLTDEYDQDEPCSGHNRKFNEVWCSIPNSGTGRTIMIHNYLRNKFFLFTFPKITSSLMEARYENGELIFYRGTRDGYLYKQDLGYQDGATDITCRLRKGWIKYPEHGLSRRMNIDYEIPNGKKLTVNVYTDYHVNPEKSKKLTGVAIDSEDIDLRRPVDDIMELGGRGKVFNVELINDENLGGDLKINALSFTRQPTGIKGKTHGN